MSADSSVSIKSGYDLTGSAEELPRLIELGRLSASLIHEISSPLTIALLHAENMKHHKCKNVRSIRYSLNRLNRYVNVARNQINNSTSSSYFCINQEIKDVRRFVAPLAKMLNVKLIFSPEFHLKIYGEPVIFQQILINLITNAIESYPSDLNVRNERIVEVVIKNNSKYVYIEVRDYGLGINPEHLQDIFHLFNSTKRDTGKGLGIGLYMVKKYITEEFRGTIKVKSTLNTGTSFKIRLPLQNKTLTR